MKKTLPFDALSNDICMFKQVSDTKFCGRKLKQRLVDQKPTVRVCYKHYVMLRRKSISDQDIRNGRY